jgi:hypothetical protein
MLTGNLEYIISSLPNLSFSDTEALKHEVKSLFQKYASVEEASKDLISVLQVEASKYLSTKAFERFQNVNFNTIHQSEYQNSKTDVVAEFSQFMFLLKSELKTYRLARKSEESSTKVNYEWLPDLSENPLEAEQQLLKLQWGELEALTIGHYSDFSALILYKLKLQLLLRWWSFDMETGFDVFQKTLNVA